jgi:hypothetical protein
MVTRPRVILVSNDVVPGMTMPVAAPGLRVFGLAQGLAAHGVDVDVAVVQGPVDGQWRGSVPAPARAGTEIVAAGDLAAYLEARAPAVAVVTNSNQIDKLRRIEGITFVLDFFAPKMLERAYEFGQDYPADELRALRARKLRAIDLADGFIVNGRKKVPYFVAWVLQTDRDIRRIRFPVVEMCLPSSFREERPPGPLRLALAGYLQGWSRPGPWLDPLLERLVPGKVVLDVVMPVHWGQRGGEELAGPLATMLGDHPAVTVHGAMTFGEFRQFLDTVDVAVDVFGHSLEREFAMVTRSVVALASGVPVIHPYFTEVTPMIEEFDAGWVVVPGEPTTLAAALDEIISSPETVQTKAEGARALWSARLEPRKAVRPLVDLIDKLG